MSKLKTFSDQELEIRNEGLKKIKFIMDEMSIDFFLMMGVLLGAIREKNFIKWDWDVELGVFTENIINQEKEINRKFKEAQFSIDFVDLSYEGYKINLFFQGNKFTLWGLHKKNGYVLRKSFKFPEKYFYKFDELLFLGEKYKIPSNVEELLQHIYGDWKTPIQSDVKNKYLQQEIFIKQSLFDRISKKIKRFF